MSEIRAEIRASALAIYADDEHGNPLLVARDEHGVLRLVTRVVRVKAEFVGAHLKGRGDVLVIETEP